MGAIFKREFKSHFFSLRGFVFVSVLLLFLGIFTKIYNFGYLQPSVAYTLHDMRLILALLVPILCMTVISAEWKDKTYRFLFSLPISSGKIVAIKYSALLGVFAIPTVAISLMPLVLNFFGEINFVASYGAILCFFLLGGALISICMFVSSCFESTLHSGIACYITIVAMYILDLAASVIDSLLDVNEVVSDLLGCISFFGTFDSFLNGVFDIGAIVYYVLIASAFFILTVRSVEKKRRV